MYNPNMAEQESKKRPASNFSVDVYCMWPPVLFVLNVKGQQLNS